MRLPYVVVLMVVVATDARAAFRATYSTDICGCRATHIVVIDDTGKVLESWRGDLAVGTSVPLKEFKIRLEHKVEQKVSLDGKELPKLPDKISGKRLVVFLRKGTPRLTANNPNPTVDWDGGHWCGHFEPSTVWIENGLVFSLRQLFSTVGPLRMTYLSTEPELRKELEQIEKKFRNLLAEARGIPKRALRTPKLVALLEGYPGFAGEVFAELDSYGSDALPALQAVVKSDKCADTDMVAAYKLMAKIGEPARDDLMAMCKAQLTNLKTYSDRIELFVLEESLGKLWYLFLKAGLSNPDAFRGLSDTQRETLRELRAFWLDHAVLSKLDEKGDQIPDRIDRILKK